MTGLNQKVGNFPGVTVEKKTGHSSLSESSNVEIIDLPGTYSLYPRREDEWVSYKVLLDQDKALKADVIVVVADASNLKRNLLLCTQIIDLKIPVVVALTMMDLAKNKGIKIDIATLERELGILVVPINPRKNKGIVQLKKAILQTIQQAKTNPIRDFIDHKLLAGAAVDDLKLHFPGLSDYTAIHYLINHESFQLEEGMQQKIDAIEVKKQF